MNAFVYLITRNDGLQYIGITNNVKKRISAHKKTNRFSIGIKYVEILKECKTYEEAEKLEPEYIAMYDTFNNGLNESVNGKGNHLAPNFTTKGFIFSDETKEKMKTNHWSKTGKYRPVGIPHTEDTKKHWSAIRKGKCWGTRKISAEDALKIKNLFEADSLDFEIEFIKKFVKEKHKSLVGKISFEELKTPNGKQLNKVKLYSEHFASIYNVNPATIRAICLGDVCDDA